MSKADDWAKKNKETKTSRPQCTHPFKDLVQVEIDGDGNLLLAGITLSTEEALALADFIYGVFKD